MNSAPLDIALKAPEAEPMMISVRGFVPTPTKGEDVNRPPRPLRRQRGSSEFVLISDTETTTDERQSLRFGAYQVRKTDELMECGLFYEPTALTIEERSVLAAFASRHDLKLLTREEYIDSVFYQVGYQWRATIVGFNLPFDLSRLATRHGSARGAAMHGGFTFEYSSKPWQPNVQIKHISRRSALIQFAKPPRRNDTRGERKRQFNRGARRGSFLDVKTLAAALLSRSFSLGSLADFLKIAHRKQAVEEHGGPMTAEYIAYCVNDVQATWECYAALRQMLHSHQLTQTRPSQILSEASLGKAYLKEFGVRPFKEIQPDFPRVLTGAILSAYFGGRAEVRWRREIKQVLYCDFLSMYPSVCTLMGLFRFVIAKGMTWRDSTAETKTLLQNVNLPDLQQQDFWKGLTTLVKVRPEADIFPVRASYGGASKTIGLNLLSSETPLWYTLADVIASKLLTGDEPEIVQAITFEPGSPQEGLRPFAIAGKAEFRIDPVADDFFKRVIDLRRKIRARMKKVSEAEKAALDAQQHALKLLANATSYGIFVEVNVNDLDRRETRECFGPSGAPFAVETDKSEEPGRYFHPLLATLITGAARLMLAISEKLTHDAGLDWAFCDTDSMALAKPDDMDQASFFAKAEDVCQWFEPLNPYEGGGSLFKIEDANYRLSSSGDRPELEPLYCLCVSAKRYALFNISSASEPIIRKASAHGLGHFMAPYDENDAPAAIPAPTLKLSEIGVERWQYDLWFKIIRAVLDGHPNQVDLTYHDALNQPAASRYGATTPTILRWLKIFNQDRAYGDQVKPFNFLVSFQSRLRFAASEFVFGPPKRGRRPKIRTPKPIAPFDKDISKASANAFDRETGERISSEQLKTYREALAQFHLSPESKFLNGEPFDRGRTERRHIKISGVSCIGKEANRWEEQFFAGFDESAEIDYGAEPGEITPDERLRRACAEFGQRKTAANYDLSRSTLIRILQRGSDSIGGKLRGRIAGKP